MAYVPELFTVVCPFALYANTVGHITTSWSKNQVPYMSYYTIFYVLIFSAIPHKEQRFLLPILPFAALITAEHIEKFIKG